MSHSELLRLDVCFWVYQFERFDLSEVHFNKSQKQKRMRSEITSHFCEVLVRVLLSISHTIIQTKCIKKSFLYCIDRDKETSGIFVSNNHIQ